MLEVIFLFLVVAVLPFVESFGLQVIILTFALLLVSPGVYSMLKGAPFVPTNKKRVDAIIDLGDFREGDRVVDLGCGDGRILRRVAGLGVKKVVGYEFSFFTYLLAQIMCFRRCEVEFGDFWAIDYKDFDVLIMFLFEEPMRRFEKEVWPTLKPGTRVITNEFRMPGVEYDTKKDMVYLYIKK